ncbi:MAG TPA: ElyC/SanA/YdcF family protein [Vicinamibacterales bacterium]
MFARLSRESAARDGRGAARALEAQAAPAVAAVPVAGSRGTSRRSRFWVGVLCGVLGVLAARWVINRTPFADYLVAPLVRSDTSGSADVIVVLGAGVVGDCVVNGNGLRRVMLASRLWHAGRAPVMLITGGRPRGRACPVSEVMAGVARRLGVPTDRILLETESHSTYQNAIFSDPILKQRNARRLLVVTDRLHMTRAGGAFARLGYAIERASVPVYEGHPNNVSMLAAGFREYAALAYYRWRGWVAPLDAADAPPQRVRAGTPRDGLIHPKDEQPMTQTTPTSRPDTIVILGASYAAGWHPQVPGLTFVNKGIAGQQSFELLERFERDVVPANPRAVIIWGFINDIFRAPGDGVDAAVERARKTLTALVEAARKHGIEPVLATEVTIRPPASWSETLAAWVGWAMGKESYQDRINKRVRETNEWVREFARREGILLLDLEPVLADRSGQRRREFAKEDGSHIPPAGYEALSAYATPVLALHFTAGR